MGHDPSEIGPGTFNTEGDVDPSWSFPGKVGIGTTNPGTKLEVNGGDFKIQENEYYYTRQEYLTGFHTPRCSCDDSTTLIDCDFGFFSYDEGLTCYDQSWKASGGVGQISIPHTRTNAPIKLQTSGNKVLIGASPIVTGSKFKVESNWYKRIDSDMGSRWPQCHCATTNAIDCSSEWATNDPEGTICYDNYLSGSPSFQYSAFYRAQKTILEITENKLSLWNGDLEIIDGDIKVEGINLGLENYWTEYGECAFSPAPPSCQPGEVYLETSSMACNGLQYKLRTKCLRLIVI